MPKFPEFAERTRAITGSVFEKFAQKMREQGDRIVNLAIGDCYAPPPYATPIDAFFARSHPGFNRYCDTFGVMALREALVEKLREDNSLEVAPRNVMMTSGTCNGLAITSMGLLDPGDEVLVLSPFWPFFGGMVKLAGGKVVEAPFYTRLYEDPALDIGAYLDDFVTSKTVAIYCNTPNNPSGKVVDRGQLAQIAAFASRHNLWVISDEAYDGLTYDGCEHVSIGALDGMFDRTLSFYTFSKVYMFSGLRLGYVVANEDVLRTINKIMVHQLYGPATVSQMMMVEPVRTRRRWRDAFIEESWKMRDRFIDMLAFDVRVPQGTYYVFFPATAFLNGRDYWELIEACLDAGVAVAPGKDFGRGYEQWIRLCFTGEPPERIELAAERLNAVLGL